MTWRRASWCLAILAALLGAPSVALGAPPNRLAAPAVAPPSGTTETAFAFSVTYLSSAGNPAESVTATVAARTLEMRLAAGTTVSGTWTASATLPAGSWPVTFRAFPSKGPQPEIAGPTVTVSAVAPPTPAPTLESKTDASPGASTGAETGAGASAAGDPLPAATSTPAAGPAAPGPGSGTTASTTSAAPAGSGTSGATPPSNPAAPGASPAGTSKAPAPEASGAATDTGPLPGRVVGSSSELAWRLMVGGLIAVAAVAAVGTAWLILGRRRRDEEPAFDDAVPAAVPDAATSALLDRRSRRRARIRETDDPVLASMGLTEAAGGSPRVVEPLQGPGEREAARARRRTARREGP